MIDGILAYLVFHTADAESHLTGYRADLQRLRSLIGNIDGFPFLLVSVGMQPTQTYREVAGLKKGDATTGQAIRQILATGKGPLFDFGPPRIGRI